MREKERVVTGERAIVLATGLLLVTAGCVVSQARYDELLEKYQHISEAKTTMDREYMDLRQQVTVMEQSHGKLAGQVAALKETVDATVAAKVAPVSEQVERAKSELRKDLLTIQQDQKTAAIGLAQQMEQMKSQERLLTSLTTQLDRLEEQLLELDQKTKASPPAESPSERAAAPRKSTSPKKAGSSRAGKGTANKEVATLPEASTQSSEKRTVSSPPPSPPPAVSATAQPAASKPTAALPVPLGSPSSQLSGPPPGPAPGPASTPNAVPSSPLVRGAGSLPPPPATPGRP
jgi:hypothetical protein